LQREINGFMFSEMDEEDKKLEAFFKKTKKMVKHDEEDEDEDEDDDEEEFDPSKAKYSDFFAEPKYVF